MVVGDGGVGYSSNLATASNTNNFIDNEAGMVTTQFYSVAQSGQDFSGSDYVIWEELKIMVAMLYRFESKSDFRNRNYRW